MNRPLILAALATPALVMPSLAAEQSSSKPNIIFLFADDHSFECIGSLSPRDKIHTPNLDQLIKEGALFTNTFNQGAWNGAVSAASRAMLATGAYVWNAADCIKQEGFKSWGEKMSSAGYDTYFTGKWHVNGYDVKRSFDEVRNVRGGMAKQTETRYNRKFIEGERDTWCSYDESFGGHFEGEKHWAEVVADDAVDYINMATKSDKPFFMYLAFNSPHDPRQAPKSYYDLYKTEDIAIPESFLALYPYASKIGCPKGLRDERLAPWPRTEYSIRVNRHEYYAMISHLDAQIGAIVEELRKSGKMENTYIIYTADHGLAVGDHGFLGKQNMYDASTRVPFIIVGPGVKEGVKYDDLIYLQDIMATSLDWAESTETQDIAFQSLCPILNGAKKSSASREAIYGAYMKLQRSIRTDEYQMIIYPTINVVRLYNIKKDPYALNDLAQDKKYIKTMKSLYAEFLNLQKETNDKVDCSAVFNEFIGKFNTTSRQSRRIDEYSTL